MSETLDLSSLSDALQRLGAPVADWTPVLRQLSVYLPGVSKRAIHEQRSPGGTPFAPLKPSTLRKRRKKGKGAKALYDTGLLISAYSAPPVGPAAVLWTNGQQTFKWHQAGTSRMPARKTVEVSPAVADTIARMAADHAAKDVARRGLRR